MSKTLFINVLSRVFNEYIFVFSNTRFFQSNLSDIVIQFFFDKTTNSLFFQNDENSFINLKKIFTSTKKYIITSFDRTTFKTFTKNFIVNFKFFAKKFACETFDVLKIIDIIKSMKNNCKLKMCIINIIDNVASNDVDNEITIVIIQTISNVSIIFLNHENLYNERKIFIINSMIFSSTKKTFE